MACLPLGQRGMEGLEGEMDDVIHGYVTVICLEWEIVVVVWGILWFIVVDSMGNCNPCSPRNMMGDAVSP